MTCRLTLVALCLAAAAAGSVPPRKRAGVAAGGPRSRRTLFRGGWRRRPPGSGPTSRRATSRGSWPGWSGRAGWSISRRSARSTAERGLAMRDDALFRLYSMTRPITSLAAMICGRRTASSSTTPSPGTCRSSPTSASSRMHPTPTWRRHAAGRRDDRRAPPAAHLRSREPRIPHLPRRAGAAAVHHAAADGGQRHAGAAVRGSRTRWRYGISTTILGRLVEVWSGCPSTSSSGARVRAARDDRHRLSGRPLPRRPLRPRLPARAERRVRPYAIEEVPFTEQPALIEGGVGLVSTVRDYLRFSQMFLNGGELDGVRILQPSTVAL